MSRSTKVLWAAVLGSVVMLAGCANPETAKRHYLESGDQYVAEGRLREAIVQYRNALRQDPQFGEARWKLANALLDNQETRAALREFIVASDLQPENAEAQLMAARILLYSRQFEDAQARAERLLEVDPQNIEGMIIRANAMAGLRDVPAAIEEMREAIETDPNDWRVYAHIGSFELSEGNKLEAESAFRQAVEISPDSVNAKLALAGFYLADRRYADGERWLKETLTLEPENADANSLLASLYLQSGRAREAEAPLKVAVNHSGDAASKMLLADYYLSQNRRDDAAPILKEAAAERATFAPATLRLAQLERAAGRRDAGLLMLDQIVKTEPANALPLAVKSEWAMQDGDIKRALELGTAAVKLDPALVRAQFALGVAQAANEQRTEAIAAFNEVLRLNQQIFGARVFLARLQLAAGNRDAAVATARLATQARPGDVDAHLVLARALLAQGDATRAAVEVRALVAAHPQVADVHAINGLLALDRDDLQGARAAFQRALGIDPDAIDALRGMLVVDTRTNNLAAAVSRIESRVGKAPDRVGFQFIAGQTYAAAGQSDKSEQAFRRVIELQPDHLDAYLALGRLYVSERRLDEALAEFDRAAARRPADVAAPTMAAMILQIQNKTAEAQKRYEAIVGRSSRAAVAANNLAWLYAENGGNLDLALQYAQAAKAQMPSSPPVNDTLGWIYYKKDLPGPAIPPLEESVAGAPANPTYHYHLGLAYAKAGQAEKARDAFNRALQLNPKFEGATAARQALAGLGTN